MNFPLSFIFGFLFLIVISFSCSSKEQSILSADSIGVEVIYVERGCCQHFKSIIPTILPDSCGQPFDGLFAINLEDFDIPQQYSLGDTLIINFNFTDVCEAQGDNYNCFITCDYRHGVPIELISHD